VKRIRWAQTHEPKISAEAKSDPWGIAREPQQTTERKDNK
jgi:hypothetical protein